MAFLIMLKPLLLPLWNGGHRLAWRVGEHLDALRHRRYTVAPFAAGSGRCFIAAG